MKIQEKNTDENNDDALQQYINQMIKLERMKHYLKDQISKFNYFDINNNKSMEKTIDDYFRDKKLNEYFFENCKTQYTREVQKDLLKQNALIDEIDSLMKTLIKLKT
jgi:hypothetical protein